MPGDLRATTVKRWGPWIDKLIVPYLGDLRLCDLRRPHVYEWRDRLRAAAVPPIQCNRALTVLSAALGYAEERGLIDHNPCRGVKKFKEQRKLIVPLTPDEVEAVRAAMEKPRDKLMVSLMAYAGLRPEEALGLSWRHVQPGQLLIEQTFAAGELAPFTKTGKPRVVTLVGPLSDELEAFRPADALPDVFVIQNRWGGGYDLDNWRGRYWSPAREAAGVDAYPYVCRHTFASLLAHEGRTIWEVGEQMGHGSARMTELYTHVFKEAAGHRRRLTMAKAIPAARRRVALQSAKNLPKAPGQRSGVSKKRAAK